MKHTHTPPASAFPSFRQNGPVVTGSPQFAPAIDAGQHEHLYGDLQHADRAMGGEATQVHTVSRRVQVVNLLGVIIPFAALVAAIIMLWGVAFNWVYLALLFGMYVFSGLGITIGYHRLFTHKSFATTRFMTWLWAVAGSSAAEGSVLEWVAYHRRHHQFSDEMEDPHSPHAHDHSDSMLGFIKGFWHSHMGWFVSRDPADAPEFSRYVPDLQKDPVVVSVDRHWRLWTLIGCLVPAVLGGLITWSWMGILLGFLWGGLVRVFLVHHITWSINSVCHIWGSRPFESHDQSRNNAIFAVVGFGEGWHNNHHAFPTSAKHGLRWWQIDWSWIVIRSMKMMRLAWDVKVPSRARIQSKLRKGAGAEGAKG